MREEDERYFGRLEDELDVAMDVASEAKARGGDPKPDVEIPIAKDMADRVENILGIDGVAERVRDLEGEMSREEAALELVTDFVEGRVGDYESREGKIEGAVRTAVALLTEGVVAAPIEGIDRVELNENDDGTEFVAVYYAGPIRSAGGTAQALSVLVADYARALLDVDEFRARDQEVERYAEEVGLYDKETGLQYSPKDKETKFITRHCPIMLDGEATGEEEVSGFRDLERIETNSPRGGMCLVLAEGIALKAPKIKRYTRNLEEVDWPWLDDLIDGTIGDADGEEDDAGDESESGESDEGDDASDEPAEREGPPRVDSSKKFLRDLIAGRPVFSHPSETGGFRLHYGRSRNHGFATAGVHPATMHLVDDFLATGTQIKTELPGKAAGVVPVDSIEGPTVRLANGEVRQIDDPAEALEIRNGVEKIIDVGEYLVNYGEFVENNYPLAPAGYTFEWWIQEFDETGVDVQAMEDSPGIDLRSPGPDEAIEWATEHDAPLHPDHTCLWHDIDVETFEAVVEAVEDGTVDADIPEVQHNSVEPTHTDVLVLPRTETVLEAVEALLLEHTQTDTTLRVPVWRPFVRSLGFAVDGDRLTRTWETLSEDARTWPNAVDAVNEVAPFEIRERSPTRVGNRMGRPEKSESRELSPAVHTLFPIGEAGGSQRDVSAAAKHADTMTDTPGEVEVQVGRRECAACGTHTFKTRCPDCDARTEPHYECPDCETRLYPDESGRVHCDHCEIEGTSVETRIVDIHAEYREALESVGERENAFEMLKGVKGLASHNKTPEPMEKGVFRAKHGVSSFKDGTVRYDMTDLPVTSVRATELDITVDQLRGLGYHEDIHGDLLQHDDQLVELKVQDVVLSDGAAEHMLKTADFVDDLLESYYGLDPYYEVEERQELVGELVFGMAPHTSAATVGRVIGFTSAAVGYAHPFFHAAKRRNCFHPETKVWYEDETGQRRYEEIRTLVENRLEDPDEDDFGTLVTELDTDVFVPSIAQDGEMERKRIEAVSKHRATDHFVEIETRSGREITVTPDHDVHVFEDGEIASKPAMGLSEDDSVLKPRHIDPIDGSEGARTFDLLAEFLTVDEVEPDRLMVHGLDKDRVYDLFEDAFAAEHDGQFYPLYSTANRLGINKKTLSNYLYRGSIPVEILEQCFEDRTTLLEWVPEDVELGIKRDSTTIDRQVELSERVATLLGYYAAEGFVRAQETPKGTIHQTTICGTEAEARDFYENVFREGFGVEPYRENDAKVTVSGRLLRILFDTVLDMRGEAAEKRVPDCVFDGAESIVAAYLRGYFSGDGTVDSNVLEVSATTISRELKEDLLALLTRLGITAQVRKTEPVPLHEKFPEFYDTDDDKQSARSYVLKISSDDAVRYAKRVGVHLSRKSELLDAQVDSIRVRGRRVFDGGEGDYLVESVASTRIVSADSDVTYSVTVEDTHSLVTNDLSQKQCDGDEDCVMLLLDGLLNFSKTYLPDQRGGSVAENSRLVATDPAGNVRFLTFDQFWDKLDSPVEHDGKFRKKTCRTEGWNTYGFDNNHNASLQPIEKAIRYESEEELLQIETQFGRSLELTKHHSLFRYGQGGIEEVAGDELSTGDLIVAPQQLDIDPVETVIDVTDCVDKPYVIIDDHVEDLLKTIWETTERGSPEHEAFNGGLSYRLRKNKLPWGRFKTILDEAGYKIPEDVKIGLQGSSNGIAREIDINEEFAWLLGLYVAEGSRSTVCPTIHNSDEDVIDRAAEIIESTVGHEPERRWSNRSYELRFPAVFRAVLTELGFSAHDSYSSSEKTIPECIRNAPLDTVRAFLRGFITGDGSDSTDDNCTTVAFHTTSEDVKDGMVFLLHRFGLVANISCQDDRPGNRQAIYTVTVSGGATDNPLHRVLNGEEPYQSKSLVVTIPEALWELREMEIQDIKEIIPKYLKRRSNISLAKLTEIVEELNNHALPEGAASKVDELRPLIDGDLSYLKIKTIETTEYDGYLYDLQVGGDPIFTANWLYAHNSMDAPLVMSSRIDPSEIDDEAHNMDVVDRYSLEFYEATREMADPESVNVEIAEDTLGTDLEYAGFGHTHDTTDIALGPDLSAYKTLDSMMDKMNAQLELSRKIRAVDETDVAERVIEYHFLPDLIGNLRAFSRQETRCLDCGEKYRRMPLSRECRECGGRVNLTVHEGSVNKYMQTAITVADEFGTRDYTKQRLEVLETKLESIFENDNNKQSGIADFM